MEDVEDCLIKDLSNTCEGIATVKLFPVDNCSALEINQHVLSEKSVCIDGIDLDIDIYQLDPTLLLNSCVENEVVKNESLVSHLLKSNCLITNQPDWASIYIQYSGKKISQKALLAYLISFRQHNEFHEQCVERIYCDIKKYCQVSELTVFARYTRRGGLDINPFRSTSKSHAPTGRTLRQ